MDNKEKYINNQKINSKILNKKRGEILYYSIDQVSDLLNESIDNIKYYTNIFDDILKIEILDKELRYKDNDIDKLELLIKLKNRGMSIKEIYEYYNKLPLNDSEIQYSEGNLLSVEELIDLIKENQQIQLNIFKDQLINDLQNVNSLYLNNISSIVIESQNKKLNELKNDLSKEITEYLTVKLDKINEVNNDIHNNIINDAKEFISTKIDNKNEELIIDFKNNFDDFTKLSSNNNDHLINEVKSFKRVMEDAYYTKCEVEMEEDANKGFFARLFQALKVN
ncbi:helix-turn-helix domain-containing protein [Clostridium sp. 1001275B_160808_H3]|uniref:helix-turn-helix domain-containing protein n=1 Tax=Clostridium sp. 1001275B_160808_H3 TaxID=2787110 RepID=UPI00189BBFC9|nr:helix-turn-helix domain-containing protein [Clostridium sp. 1001275B_160808_H3]